MVSEEATAEVPLLCDPDRPLASFTARDGGNEARDMRAAWKEYHRTRIPAAAETQIKNFMRIVSAQGRVFREDDEESRPKMDVVTVQLSSQSIASILQQATTQCFQEGCSDGTQTSWQNTKQEFANKKVRLRVFRYYLALSLYMCLGHALSLYHILLIWRPVFLCKSKVIRC